MYYEFDKSKLTIDSIYFGSAQNSERFLNDKSLEISDQLQSALLGDFSFRAGNKKQTEELQDLLLGTTNEKYTGPENMHYENLEETTICEIPFIGKKVTGNDIIKYAATNILERALKEHTGAKFMFTTNWEF